MDIPLEETPGAATQGDGRGGIRIDCNSFTLKTVDQYCDKDYTKPLEDLGFVFAKTGSPHTVIKVANPPIPILIADMGEFKSFVSKYGSIAITRNNELIILGNSDHYFPRLTEVGKPSDGYTSLRS